MASTNTQPLKRQDFVSDQDVRWCPGCGDYAVLSQVQKIFPNLGIPKENFLTGSQRKYPYWFPKKTLLVPKSNFPA